MTSKAKKREPYNKPELVKHDNVIELTCECPNWKYSVVVPPPPSP